jgi:DNA mismatch endonuclease (patch repair protein)
MPEDPSRARDPAVTSKMMAKVRNKDSKAELALRRALHARGLRYRLHARDVLGRPDVVIRAKRLAVFVDGDFWHGNAHRLRGLDRLEDLFPNRTDWWMAKLTRTMERDREVTAGLIAQGWTVVRIWESDVLASPEDAADRVVAALRARTDADRAARRNRRA